MRYGAIVLGVVLFISTPVFAKKSCEALLIDFLTLYKDSKITLPLVYGEATPYSITDIAGFKIVNDKVEYVSESFHSYRLDEVYLKITEEEDITQIAEYLSQGQRDSPQVIEQKILEYIQKFSEKEVFLIPLEYLSPRFVKINNNKYGKQRTENCFAATIQWHFFDYKIQYNTNFGTFLKKYTKPVSKKSPLRFGDIIVFRDNMGQLVHSAIYITDQLLWHKQGADPALPWTFESFSSVLSLYSEAPFLTAYRRRS